MERFILEYQPKLDEKDIPEERSYWMKYGVDTHFVKDKGFDGLIELAIALGSKGSFKGVYNARLRDRNTREVCDLIKEKSLVEKESSGLTKLLKS